MRCYAYVMEHSPQRWQQPKPVFQEQFSAVEPIYSPQVQKALMLMMDSTDRRHAAELWTEEDIAGDSLAKRFREYVELPENKDRAIDLTDEASIAKLFREITDQTLH